MSSDPCCALRAQPTVVEEPGWRPAKPTSQSWASAPAVRRSMQGNRRRDTKPEVAVRRLLHAAGFRYRVDVRPVATLNRRADIVFTRAKVAVFIDGCFWHGCPDHHTVSKANASYWAAKVERNRERDADTDRRLKAEGWHVMRAWEHEAPRITVDRIGEAVHARLQEHASRRP